MGAWAEFELSGTTLSGISPVDWPEKAGHTETLDRNMVAAAKNMVFTEAGERMAAHITSVGGDEAFFDLVAAKPALASRMQMVLGLAYVHLFYRDHAASGSGLDYEKAREFKEDFRKALKSLAALLPVSLGLSDRVQQAGTVGGLYGGVSRYEHP